MKIFVSWSGERSKHLAEALREWIPLALHYAEPWVSQSDIAAGERWDSKVAKELSSAAFGILCLTRENISAPWILFEAGALAKSMEDGRVVPLLLDVDLKEISGPLAQFQAKKTDKSGIRDVINSINKLSATQVQETRLDDLFNLIWEKISISIKEIQESTYAPIEASRSQDDILEELVSSMRNIEMRLRESTDDSPPMRRAIRPKLDLRMLIKAARHLREGPNDPLLILMAVSGFRDTAPWLYDAALHTYQSIQNGNNEVAQQSYKKLLSYLEYFMHYPFLDEIGLDRNQIKAALQTLMSYEPYIKGATLF